MSEMQFAFFNRIILRKILGSVASYVWNAVLIIQYPKLSTSLVKMHVMMEDQLENFR